MNIKSFFSKKIKEKSLPAYVESEKIKESNLLLNVLDVSCDNIYDLNTLITSPIKLLEHIDNLVFKPIESKNQIVSKTQEKIKQLNKNKIRLKDLLDTKFPIEENEKIEKIQQLNDLLNNLRNNSYENPSILLNSVTKNRLEIKQRCSFIEHEIQRIKNEENNLILKDIFNSQKQTIIKQIEEIDQLITTLKNVIVSAEKSVEPLLCVKKEIKDIISISEVTREIEAIIKETDDIKNEYSYCFEAIELLHNYCIEATASLNQLAIDINSRQQAEYELQVSI